MAFEEALSQIQAEHAATEDLAVSGQLDAESVRFRREDLQLAKALIEQGKEDPDLVLTALDLQRGAIDEGVRPLPRFLRLLREIKTATNEDPPPAPPPLPPASPEPPRPPVPMLYDESGPINPRDFRPTESTEEPVAEEFRSEDYQFFRSRSDDAPRPPLPEDPPPSPAVRPDSRRLRGAGTRTRPSSLRPRSRAEVAPAPAPARSSGRWMVWGLILLLLAGGGGAAAFFLVNRKPGLGGGGSAPGVLDSARKALQRAEELRAASSSESVSAFREALRAFDDAIRSSPSDPAAYEGRAHAKWRLASWFARADADAVADADQALQLEAGRPVALALRGLLKFQVAVHRAGGHDPWPGQAVRASLAAGFPALRGLVPGPEGMPSSFGKIPASAADLIRADLRQALDSKVAAPWAGLAEGVTAWLAGRGAEIADPGAEELLWILKASASSDARKLVADALARLPDVPALHLAKAWLSVIDGRLDDALESARRATAPEDPPGAALLASAGASVSRSRGQAAMDDLLRVPADSAMSRVLKAAASLQSGPPERALAEVEAAFEELPVPFFRLQRGFLLLAVKQRDRAKQEFVDAGLASPAHAMVRMLAALGLWTAGDFGAALIEADRAIASTSDPSVIGPSQELRALILSAQGNDKAAAEAYRAAYQARPGEPLAAEWLRFLESNHEWELLKQAAGEFVRKNPKDGRSWRALVTAAWELRDAEETVRVVGEALRNDVDAATVLGARALAREKLGKLDEALDDLKLVLTRRPDEVAYQAERARILAKRGMWEEAKADADGAITRLQGVRGGERALCSAHLALAMVYAHQASQEEEQAGRVAQQEKAISSIKHAMRTGRLDPQDIRPEGAFEIFKTSEEFKALADLARQEAETAKSRLKQQAFLGVSMNMQGGRVELSGTIRGGAARAAGLQAGDVILEVEGTPVRTFQDLQTRLQGLGPGARVVVKLERTLPTGLKLQILRDVVLTDRSVAAED